LIRADLSTETDRRYPTDDRRPAGDGCALIGLAGSTRHWFDVLDVERPAIRTYFVSPWA
jgi:hypothetical protein